MLGSPLFSPSETIHPAPANSPPRRLLVVEPKDIRRIPAMSFTNLRMPVEYSVQPRLVEGLPQRRRDEFPFLDQWRDSQFLVCRFPNLHHRTLAGEI